MPLSASAVSGGEFSHSTAPDSDGSAFDGQVFGLAAGLARHHHGRIGAHHRGAAGHDDGRLRLASLQRHGTCRAALFERSRARERNAREKAGVEAQARSRRRPAAPRRPGRAGPIRRRRASASSRRRPAPDQERQREGGRRAGRIGEQQEARSGRLPPAGPRRSGSGPAPGPAQGAQSRPVATPSRSGRQNCSNLLPWRSCPRTAKAGRQGRRGAVSRRSRKRRKQQRDAETARSASAAMRPYWLASTAQPPPTAASVATAAKVSAMPASIGSPLRRNGRSPARTRRADRQDAGADDGQNAAEIGQQEQNHG